MHCRSSTFELLLTKFGNYHTKIIFYFSDLHFPVRLTSTSPQWSLALGAGGRGGRDWHRKQETYVTSQRKGPSRGVRPDFPFLGRGSFWNEKINRFPKTERIGPELDPYKHRLRVKTRLFWLETILPPFPFTPQRPSPGVPRDRRCSRHPRTGTRYSVMSL